ncbi:hypothetical protein F4556_002479 [Kitasatospora gansuensis]|uniref:Uncharacterized protein n=1 Tax=Kitasatospora gansuensis TaxID=258050 RepID=A0A7W7SAL3_9ACTN|nr:hypothetical protein [Kitasatospora gansuensis]MBB4946944.1 hypothetical protein [Kitasatospora gansuensis]
MGLWEACLCGTGGAALVEAAGLYLAIHRVGGYPWQENGQLRIGPYLLAVAIRLGLGCGLALLLTTTGAGTPLRAAVAGMASPVAVIALARRGSALPEVAGPTRAAGVGPESALPPAEWRSSEVARPGEEAGGDVL